MPRKPRRIDLIGIATAAGASVRGCGMGPEALRVAGLPEALVELGYGIADHGDLRRPHPEISTDPASWRLPEERKADVLELAARSSELGAAVLGEGHFPLCIGGDHSIAIGTISAAARHCEPLRATGAAGACAVDRCPCGLQHAPDLPQRQPSWYAPGPALR